MAELTLSRANLYVCAITARTRWIFISLETADGITGYGEATLTGQETEVSALFSHYAENYLSQNGASPRSFFSLINNLPLAALASGFDQALWDIKSKAAGKPLASLLCTQPEREISVYANINRKTTTRTSEAFAENALRAMDDGHTAFKLAPFDEVNCHTTGGMSFSEAVKPGLERIARVRTAVGVQARLMVDCHWRMDADSARQLINLTEQYRLYWLECPVPETEENISVISSLRAYANSKGMLLAGFEEYIRLEAFLPFLSQKSCDVYMPDAKYAGGIKEMLQIAAAIRGSGAVFSPHNPSGPVCDAVSAHLCAASPGAGMLEMQYDESPLFYELTGAPPRIIKDGRFTLTDVPGHGVNLCARQLQKCVIHSVHQKR